MDPDRVRKENGRCGRSLGVFAGHRRRLLRASPRTTNREKLTGGNTMVYKHDLWDPILKILDYTIQKLEKTGPGVMTAEIRQVRDNAIKQFEVSGSQLEWIFTYLCNDGGVLSRNELNTLDANEQEAARSSDLFAHSQAEAEKSVREAEKRLRKAKKMKPVTDAKKKLAQANASIEAKKQAADQARAARDRPATELKEAQGEAVKAAAELKKAELSVKI